MEKVELDVGLIELAFLYLQKKKRKKEYTYADLLWTAEKILRWSENRGKRKNNKIEFANGKIIIEKKYLKKVGGLE